MPSRIRSLTLLVTCLLLLSLSGCFDFGSNATASFTLGVKDTPVDGAQRVVIAFTGVDLMSSKGLQSFKFAGGRQVDLLRYQGDDAAILLGGVGIADGNFQWIRLNIDPANSYLIASNGNQYPLKFPSGSQTGLKLVSAFTVAKNDIVNFVVDFNLRKSITESSSGGTPVYTLNPALRLIRVLKTGYIAGTVASTLTIGGTPISTTGCYPAVYVYSGTPTTLGGFQATVSGATAPLTSTTLGLNNATGDYEYELGYLAPGTYTVAITCAGDDTAGAASLAFSPSKTRTVKNNTIGKANF